MPLPSDDRLDQEPETLEELRAKLEAMTASEQRLRDLMNSDPFAFLIGAIDRTVRYMNPPLREMLGYTTEQIGRGEVRWNELTSKEFAARDQQAYEELLSTGKTRLFENKIMTSDGRNIPILMGSSLISDGRGGREVAVFITDLSDLQYAQRQIQDQNASIAVSDGRSRQLLRANPFGLLIASHDGEVRYVNPPLLKLLDYTTEDIDERRVRWDELMTPRYIELARNARRNTLATGNSAPFELEFLTKTGRTLPVLIGLTLIPNLEGGHDIAAFITDLTELKKTQQQLLKSQQDLADQLVEMDVLYQTAPIGLAYFDPREFRYLRLNEEQASIMGKSKSEVVGRTVRELAPKVEGLQELFESVVGKGPVVNHHLEGELPNKPGEIRSWTVNYFPIFSQSGEIKGIAAATLETTEKRRAEAALQESEKLAAVGRLASSISHEINNPLEAITNLLFLARNETDDAKRNGYLDTAEHEVARVSQIATQTLRFHRQPGRPSTLSIPELIDAVLALYAGRLSNSGIHIERKFRSHTPFESMEGDIRQVLNNLIGNAIDAMRCGGGRLLIRSGDETCTMHGEKCVRLTVADSGVGMTDETQRRIYEAFYTTKGIHGTGLGMWISKDIVEKHGGKLRLRSFQQKHRHGTVFQLLLPIHPPLSSDEVQ